jgi:regulator of protease activity HflC (stomatin/prohibitin superfamily)
VGTVERLGKYDHFAEAGLNFICWPIDSVRIISRRVQQLNVRCETKTKDNVFVTAEVAVQYQVMQDSLWDAFYKTDFPHQQIEALVTNVIRSFLPKQELEEVFASKDELANHIMEDLQERMSEIGFVIKQCLITDLDPDPQNKRAMNQINANWRLRIAAEYQAEANKIIQVKNAEGEADSKYLSGVGVARQRRAIVDGLKESIIEFAQNVEGATPSDVIDLLLLTQYFDMLKDVGERNKQPSTLFMPHAPLNVQQLRGQLSTAFKMDHHDLLDVGEEKAKED